MTTLIINQKTKDKFSLVSPLFDPEMMMEDADLMETDSEFCGNMEEIIPANVYESEDEYILKLRAPGLNKNNIEMEIDDSGLLTVEAESEDEELSEGNYCRRKEFSPAGFNRSFQLPEDSLAEEMLADYKDGIITIRIPRIEQQDILRPLLSL